MDLGVLARSGRRRCYPVSSLGSVTKGPGSKAARLAMALTFIEAAQARLRAVNAPLHVRVGAAFSKRKLVERTTTRRLARYRLVLYVLALAVARRRGGCVP